MIKEYFHQKRKNIIGLVKLLFNFQYINVCKVNTRLNSIIYNIFFIFIHTIVFFQLCGVTPSDVTSKEALEIVCAQPITGKFLTVQRQGKSAYMAAREIDIQ